MAHDTLPHENVIFSLHRNEVDERSLYIVPETLSVHIPCDRATFHAAVHSG